MPLEVGVRLDASDVEVEGLIRVARPQVRRWFDSTHHESVLHPQIMGENFSR